MKVVFSTDAVHLRDRLDLWQDQVGKAAVAHQFDTHAGRSFRGRIRGGTLGNLSLASIESDTCAVRRTERDIKRTREDHPLLCLQLAGSTALHQDGRDTVARESDLFLLDPRRPFALDVGAFRHTLIVKIPRWELQGRVGDLRALTARPITRREPMGALASGFLAMLPTRVEALDGLMATKLAQQALDLVALALAEQMRSEPAVLSSARSTALLRLKANIEAKLHDPALRPALAAATTGISVRYANALLAEEGTSLERFIVERRLHHCRQALADPAQAFRTVTDIAYSCGFSDVSHFTRRFKAQFGHSPSECRPQRR